MSPIRKHIQPFGSTFRWLGSWLAVVIISFGALILALGAPYIFGHQLKAGDLAEQDYIAQHKAVIVDEENSRRQIETIRQRVLPVFKKDLTQKSVILSKLDEQLNLVQSAQSGSGASANEAISKLAKLVPAKDFAAWRKDVGDSAERCLSVVHFYPGANHHEWKATITEFLPEKFSPALREHSADLIADVMEPNMVVDAPATERKVQAALSSAKPVMKEIQTGTVIIARGEPLSKAHIDTLNSLGITRTRDFNNLLGIGIALLAAFGLFGVFLFTFEPAHFYSPTAIALMATVCVVTSAIASFVGHQYPEFIPLPATALILSVIFGRRVAVILALLVIVFIKVTDLLDNAQIVALAAASATALAINIKKRKELMTTGFVIGMVQSLAFFMAMMLQGTQGSALEIGRELFLQLLGGLSSCIVAIGSLPFLEIMFGIVTPFRISELTEPDQPLLRQLEEKAPGTYQHSLAVANLAEAGAKSIAADVNLVRAGAMYHDIGKMVTPRYFIENQLGDKNPHDEIAPEDSRAKVLAHVTNGLALARKYGLPQLVQDFIPEHQGTTIMAYFYHKACQRDGVDAVSEQDYRYPGPKPQSKESAIVMLADVSEAVTHSLRDPSQEEVEAAIENVFKARWDDGQFDESTLTQEELHKVQHAFVRVWRTLHHERLKYPSTTTGRMPVPPQRTTAAQQAQQESSPNMPDPGASCC